MNALRRMVFAAILLAAAAAYAVPSFTPVIDGIKDAGWGSTPDHSTTSQALPVEFNLDGGLYVTDDAEWVYFGYDADPDPLADGKSVHVHILFDVNNTAAGGTFACWGASAVAYTHPFKPEYDLVMQWNTDNQSSQFTGLNTWNINTWVQQPEITTDAGGGGQWTEVAIRKNQIGTPAAGATLNISMWLRHTWDAQGGVACLPALPTFPSDNGAVGHPLNVQFPYTVQAAFGDVVAPQLVSVHQIDRRGVELLFNEPMNLASLNNSSNYIPGGWPFTGIQYATALTVGINNFSGFADGTQYSISLTSGIRDVANNSIDPNFDSLSWTAPSYSDVLFRVEDPGATHDTIYMKGSFNFYHEYDAAWQGGNFRLYDDGTNGDAVAGDHVFSRLFVLVPNGGTPNFEWGCVDENDTWLVVGPNPSFTLPDTNDITVTYVIPNPTTNPVTVTFRCDAQCLETVGIFPDSMSVAGPFNGWNGETMTDVDLDGQWTLDVLFPAGSAIEQEFKFRFHELGGTTWEDVPNRPLSLDDSGPTQDLGNMFWNDWVCSPYSLTIATNGTDATLRWLGPERVSYDVFSHTVSDSILQNGNFEGNTLTKMMVVPVGVDAQKFFIVRAVNQP
ncbi:MAG: Ig-like domain-containing protein [Calditrichaeota bacterium]|nr:Ig-like domain-containing protein [Calditrichota bacterium]MCB9367202.1 Ig-like domain-containing protein [Calditrichota bacterium]